MIGSGTVRRREALWEFRSVTAESQKRCFLEIWKKSTIFAAKFNHSL